MKLSETGKVAKGVTYNIKKQQQGRRKLYTKQNFNLPNPSTTLTYRLHSRGSDTTGIFSTCAVS